MDTKLYFIATFICLLCCTHYTNAQVVRKQNDYTHPRPKIGEQAPDISLKSPSGKMYKLSDLKGQYVLLDFWAAWCAPCRKANRKLVKIYEKYQSNGFRIFSVSLDTDRQNWERAILVDGMTWEEQVSELQGFNGEVAIQYRVDYLPDNYLIDKTGKIIAVDLKVSELDKILKEYMAK